MKKDEILKLKEEISNSKLGNDSKKIIIDLLEETKLGLKLFFEEQIEEGLADKNYFYFSEDKNRRLDEFDGDGHLIIEGDNYFALKHLEKLGEKIDIIYIDPPYNTGNMDFIYNDKFVNKDDEFRHSKWLSFIKKRIELARNILKEDGVIFVSIDDNEQAYLKVIMDEIFGQENFVTMFGWQKTQTPPSLGNKVRDDLEYILCYEKTKNSNKYTAKWNEPDSAPLKNKGNNYVEIKFPPKSVSFPNVSETIVSKGKYDDSELFNDINVVDNLNSNEFILGFESKWNQDFLNSEIEENTKFLVKNHRKFSVRYLREGYTGVRPNKLLAIDKYEIDTNENGSKEYKKILGDNLFDHPKNSNLIKFLINITCKPNDIKVLDFFAGSGTTGQAVMQLNQYDNGKRKFIGVNIGEVEIELKEKNNKKKKIKVNIASDIAFERMYRISKCHGTNGENKFEYAKENEPLNQNIRYAKIAFLDKINGNEALILKEENLYNKFFKKEKKEINIELIGEN